MASHAVGLELRKRKGANVAELTLPEALKEPARNTGRESRGREGQHP
jgi:hypothetical protein